MSSLRATLLAQLNTLDTSVLEKLVKYSDTIIIPDSDALTKVGFTEMLDSAHTLADTYFPEWTDRSKADFGEFIVELFALFSEKDFWYLNAFANEGHLLKAKSYVNVYYHAIRNGYKPIRATSSSASFTLTFTGVPSPTTFPIGSVEVSLAGTDLVFTNVVPIVVAAGNSNIPVTLYTGRIANAVVPFNGKSARIVAKDVDYRFVRLYIDNLEWDAVDNFGDSDSSSKHFMVFPTDGNDFEVVFGMQGYGQRPVTKSNLTFLYLNCPQQNLNVGITAATVTKNVTGNYITGVVMVSASTGGAKAESLESIRQKASLMYRTRGTQSIRTPQDAISILEAYTDVRKATAFNFANQLYFAVIPEDGNPANSGFMTTLEGRIADIVIMGYVATGSLTSYVTISEITMTAFIYSEFSDTVVLEKIRDYFDFITDPMSGAAYGVGLDLGAVAQELIETVSGLSNVTFQTVNGAAANNITLTSLQIFNPINQANLTINVQKVL